MISVRLAPLAGVTDWPFRLLCFEQGCDCAYTEMVSAMGYLYAPKDHTATVSLLTRAPGEKKLILQLFGKEADLMARAAEIRPSRAIRRSTSTPMVAANRYASRHPRRFTARL